jgi:hypothetical protein
MLVIPFGMLRWMLVALLHGEMFSTQRRNYATTQLIVQSVVPDRGLDV